MLALAKRPLDLDEDVIGRTMVRRGAMALLGRIAYPDGHKYLMAEVVKPDQDFNFVPGLADGVVSIGWSELGDISDSIGVNLAPERSVPTGGLRARNERPSIG